MYQVVGTYPNARRLVELVPRLRPERSREGYATTDREATRALYAPELSGAFPGAWAQCFLAIIWQHGTIPPHADGETVTYGTHRRHLVLQSNPDAWVLHGDDWQQLDEDGIYTMDPSQRHAAVNWGAEPRIHFVVDVVPDERAARDEWTERA